jgi:hypothetical protein
VTVEAPAKSTRSRSRARKAIDDDAPTDVVTRVEKVEKKVEKIEKEVEDVKGAKEPGTPGRPPNDVPTTRMGLYVPVPYFETIEDLRDDFKTSQHWPKGKKRPSENAIAVALIGIALQHLGNLETDDKVALLIQQIQAEG